VRACRALLELVKRNVKERERDPRDRSPVNYKGIEVAYVDETGVPGAVVRQSLACRWTLS
jgi:hypothetical protein